MRGRHLIQRGVVYYFYVSKGPTLHQGLGIENGTCGVRRSERGCDRAKVTVTSTESVKVPPSVPRQHLSVPSPTEGTRDRYRYRDKRYVIDAVPRDGDAGAGKWDDSGRRNGAS